MGDEKLRFIAAELITQVRKGVTIDWTLRESARARIKVIVKRILNRHGYPPDLQAEAIRTVLQQAELLCADWAAWSRCHPLGRVPLWVAGPLAWFRPDGAVVQCSHYYVQPPSLRCGSGSFTAAARNTDGIKAHPLHLRSGS